MKTNIGNDHQASAMGDPGGDLGVSTAVAAGTLTDTTKAWVTNVHAGRIVVTTAGGGRYAAVVSNTATVLTVDRWYDASNPGAAAAASTPGTGNYVITPGNLPASWLALSTDAAAPAVTDVALAGELTANGLQRALATYGHTTGAASYTLSKTFTSTDPTPRVVTKLGVFTSPTVGRMVFESLIPTPPTIANGDTLTITETVNL